MVRRDKMIGVERSPEGAGELAVVGATEGVAIIFDQPEIMLFAKRGHGG